jgi:hypothetical protein
VQYSEIRSKIQTGDALAWSEGGSWASWRNIQLNIVKMGTMSQYNHIGVAYVLAGRVFVVEAVVPLIRIFPLSKVLPFHYIATPFRLNDVQEAKLLSRVGLPYSKWEAIKAAFSKDTNGEAVWECAKLANNTYSDFDPEFADLYDTPHATVQHLMEKHNCSPIYIGP